MLSITSAPSLVAASSLFWNAVLQRGFFLVQLAQRGLVGIGQLGAGAHEVAVVALDQEFVDSASSSVALVVERLDAREQLRIEEDRILVRGELRRLVFLDLLQRVVRVRLRQREEHLADARQQRAGALHRDDRVVEGRRGGLVGDLLDLGELLLHAFLDRRLEIAVVDLVERRRLVLQRARTEERIGRNGLAAAALGGSAFGGVCAQAARTMLMAKNRGRIRSMEECPG